MTISLYAAAARTRYYQHTTPNHGLGAAGLLFVGAVLVVLVVLAVLRHSKRGR